MLESARNKNEYKEGGTQSVLWIYTHRLFCCVSISQAVDGSLGFPSLLSRMGEAGRIMRREEEGINLQAETVLLLTASTAAVRLPYYIQLAARI